MNNIKLYLLILLIFFFQCDNSLWYDSGTGNPVNLDSCNNQYPNISDSIDVICSLNEISGYNSGMYRLYIGMYPNKTVQNVYLGKTICTISSSGLFSSIDSIRCDTAYYSDSLKINYQYYSDTCFRLFDGGFVTITFDNILWGRKQITLSVPHPVWIMSLNPVITKETKVLEDSYSVYFNNPIVGKARLSCTFYDTAGNRNVRTFRELSSSPYLFNCKEYIDSYNAQFLELELIAENNAKISGFGYNSFFFCGRASKSKISNLKQ